ncbi:hypothetical protein ABW20_dc0107076 [Dactylellina cionopaga]|nr:hypothetical protein ABW20_dc0107076 [Dactylellina cionopaga]
MYDAKDSLEDFAHAIEYIERMFNKIYPFKPPTFGIEPDEVANGIRLVDITFKNLDLDFKYRIFRAQNLLKQIKVNNGQLDEGLGQNNIHTFGFKSLDLAKRLLPALERLYKVVHDQESRMLGLQRWIEDDLINHNFDSWAKDPMAIAITAVHALIDRKNPNLVSYSSFQRTLWRTYLLETETAFEDVTYAIQEMLEIFAKNQPPVEKIASFDFNLDFRPHLKRLENWFSAWRNRIALLRKRYEAIPLYPSEPGVPFSSAGAIGVNYETHSDSSFNIHELEAETDLAFHDWDEGGISEIPKVCDILAHPIHYKRRQLVSIYLFTTL